MASPDDIALAARDSSGVRPAPEPSMFLFDIKDVLCITSAFGLAQSTTFASRLSFLISLYNLTQYTVPYASQSCSETFQASGANATVGGNVLETAQSVVVFGSGGAMYSTIGDLLTWASTGMGDCLLSDPASVDP